MEEETVKVAFKLKDSLPARRADCIHIRNGFLLLSCKRPGYEIEILRFLLKVLKLDAHWIETRTSSKALALTENCTADLVGNIKAQHKMVTNDVLTARAGLLHESTSFLFRKPEPGEYAWEESMLRSFKNDVWFSIIACIILSALSVWIASGFRIPLFRTMYGFFRIFVSQSFDAKPKFMASVLSVTYVVLLGYYNRVLLASLMIRKMEIRARMSNADFGNFALKRGFHILLSSDIGRKRLLEQNDPQLPDFTKHFKNRQKVEPAYAKRLKLIENSKTPPYMWLASTLKASYVRFGHPHFMSVESLDGYFEYDSYLICKKRKDLVKKLTTAINVYKTFVNKITEKYALIKNLNYSLKTSRKVALKLVHFAFGFCILLPGYLISFLGLLCEIRAAFTHGDTNNLGYQFN